MEFLDRAKIDRLTAATAAPMYATSRRGRFYELLGANEVVDLEDSKRVDAVVDTVEAGFDGVDLELDTFDPTPGPETFSEDAIRTYADESTGMTEVTDDTEAVDRQREAIDRVHRDGGEVVLSAHTYENLSPADVEAVASRITDRGADFVKIVGVDRSMDEALETHEAHLRLNEAGMVTYALMAIGKTSRITRPLAPMFGSALVFAQPELTPSGFHSWPLVENASEVLQRVDWRTAHDPHREE